MLVQTLQNYFEEGDTIEKLKSRPAFDQKYINIFAGPSLLPEREDHALNNAEMPLQVAG